MFKNTITVLIYYRHNILDSYHSRDNENPFPFTQQLSQSPLLNCLHTFINCFSKYTTSEKFKLKEAALKKFMYRCSARGVVCCILTNFHL
jgi:fructose-1,6-bisphosphatase